MSLLSKIFPTSHHSMVHSPRWFEAGEGFICGHIYSKVFIQAYPPPKWTQYIYTLLMSASALYSLEHSRFFTRHMGKVELFRYAVLFAATHNFLKAFFHGNRIMVPRNQSRLEKCSNWLWRYTPAILSSVNIGLTILEARKRPLKAISSIIGYMLNYRDH